MNTGTPKVVVRVPKKIQDLIQFEVDTRNLGSCRKPYTVSDFIRSAILEKLKHLARGRKFRGVHRTEDEIRTGVPDVFDEA
jgi:hypothetical protein